VKRISDQYGKLGGYFRTSSSAKNLKFRKMSKMINKFNFHLFIKVLMGENNFSHLNMNKQMENCFY